MRLHKFLPLEFAIADVALRRLKVARLEDLNDPFELFAARTSDRQTGERLPGLKSELDERTGLLCFSRDWQNPVLWSHYASRHTGACLSFDIGDDEVRLVDYRADRLQLPDEPRDDVDAAIAERLITTKYRDWDYEQEARIVMPLEGLVREGRYVFRDFGDGLALREVRLGTRCTLSLEQAQRLVERFEPPVRVATTRLSFSTFRVVERAATD